MIQGPGPWPTRGTNSHIVPASIALVLVFAATGAVAKHNNRCIDDPDTAGRELCFVFCGHFAPDGCHRNNSRTCAGLWHEPTPTDEKYVGSCVGWRMI